VNNLTTKSTICM